MPLPKPTYLSAPVVPTGATAPALDHAAALAAAAAEAERAQRAVVEVSRPAANRFARMGLVEGLPARVPDLDEVLQRRRAAS